MRLWRTFQSKEEDKSKLITAGEKERSLEAIKRCTYLIKYKSVHIPVHVYREKWKKGASEDTSERKATEVSEGIAEAIDSKKAGPCRELEPLNREGGNLDGLQLDLLKLNSEMQGSTLLEEEDDTPTGEKNFEALIEPMSKIKVAQVNLHHAKSTSVVITRASSKDYNGIVLTQEPRMYRE